MKMQCPTEETIADYLEGRLAEPDLLEAEDHFSACDICLESLVIGKRYVHNREAMPLKPVPDAVTMDAIRSLPGFNRPIYETLLKKFSKAIRDTYEQILDYLNPFFTGWHSYAPIRSAKTGRAKDCIQIRKQFHGMTFDIEIETAFGNGAAIRVNLLNHQKFKGIRVNLTQEAREISSYLLTDGFVCFEDVLPGTYALVFVQDGAQFGNYGFEIKREHS